MRQQSRLILCSLAVSAFFCVRTQAQQPAAADGAPLRINNAPVELRIGFVGEGIARFQFLPLNPEGQAVESPDAPLLVPQKWRNEPARLRTLPAQVTSWTQDKWRLSFDPATWTISLGTIGGPGQKITVDPATGKMSFLVDGPLFGLGEGGKPHDRRGAINHMAAGGWNDPSFPLGDWGEHLGIPWLVSPSGESGAWGLYVHSPAGEFDLTGKEGVFLRSAGGGGGRARGTPATPPAIDCFIVLADAPPRLMKAWAEISGYPSLPPIWSLGYIQSHRELASAEQILTEAKTFREKNMPCDMVIYLGTGFIPTGGWNTGHGEFTFNKAIFSDPEAQLKQFHDLHFKVAVHVTPRGPNPPRLFTGRVTDPIAADAGYDANSVAQYWNLHVPIMKQGVDAWWPDEGEGFTPAARLGRIQMYWDGPQMLHPDQRPFALHRTGAVGMQRYGGFLWSGDIKSRWDVLARHVPLGLNISAGGTPYWGTDTGGFYQDQARELTGELWARWFQFSTFTPLFRSHGQQWQTRHLPWGFSVINGAERDPKIEEICKKYLDLRYQLMPYTYSAVYEGHENGMPIMRALWLHHPNDPKAVERGDEYLWGRDLLVAPVVAKGETEHKLYLPRGRWYDYWTGDVQEGGREITRAVDLSTMPLYARAGAIIPHGPKENYTLEKPNDPLTINVYPGADGQFTMIEDDGVTFSSKPMRLRFNWTDGSKTLAIALEPGSQMREPLARRIEVKLIGAPATKTVNFNGAPVTVQF